MNRTVANKFDYPPKSSESLFVARKSSRSITFVTDVRAGWKAGISERQSQDRIWP